MAWFARNIVKTYRPHVPWTQLAIADLAVQELGKTRSFWSYTLESCSKTLSWLSQHTIVQLQLDPVLVLSIFMGGLIFAVWRLRKKFPALLIIYGTGYIFFLVSYLVLSKQTMEIDQRYMMIFYMYLLLLFVIGAHREFGNFKRHINNPFLRKFFYLTCALAFVLWFGFSIKRTGVWALETMKHGADKTDGPAWGYVNTRQWFP